MCYWTLQNQCQFTFLCCDCQYTTCLCRPKYNRWWWIVGMFHLVLLVHPQSLGLLSLCGLVWSLFCFAYLCNVAPFATVETLFKRAVFLVMFFEACRWIFLPPEVTSSMLGVISKALAKVSLSYSTESNCFCIVLSFTPWQVYLEVLLLKQDQTTRLTDFS